MTDKKPAAEEKAAPRVKLANFNQRDGVFAAEIHVDGKRLCTVDNATQDGALRYAPAAKSKKGKGPMNYTELNAEKAKIPDFENVVAELIADAVPRETSEDEASGD